MKLECRLFSVVKQVNKRSSWGLILTLAVVHLCSHWFIPVQAGLTWVVLRNLVFCVWYPPSATFIFFAEKGTLIHEKPFRVWGLFVFFFLIKIEAYLVNVLLQARSGDQAFLLASMYFCQKRYLAADTFNSFFFFVSLVPKSAMSLNISLMWEYCLFRATF